MLTDERYQAILATLEENKIIKVQELIQLLDASESTIRRDLQELENQNLLQRVHGGAKKMQQLAFEPNMVEKTKHYSAEKKAIAHYAASLIRPKDVLFIDAGTTTMAMISEIPYTDSITVVTNSVKHAALMIDRQIETIILGGAIKLSTNAVRGTFANDQLKQLRFNKSFMGMNGAHLEAGFTTPDPEEAAIKRIAITQSDKSYVLIDHSKFQETSFAKVADLSSADIICDDCPASYHPQFNSLTKIKEVKK